MQKNIFKAKSVWYPYFTKCEMGEVMNLGARIRKLREEAGLTQLAFAKILNINNSTLSQYESGDRIPSDATKVKIADHFDISLDYLLGRTEQKGRSSTQLYPAISSEEMALLAAYRAATPEDRAIIDNIVLRYAQSGKAKNLA